MVVNRSGTAGRTQVLREISPAEKTCRNLRRRSELVSVFIPGLSGVPVVGLVLLLTNRSTTIKSLGVVEVVAVVVLVLVAALSA